MKNFIYVFAALVGLTLFPTLSQAANPFLSGDVIVVAGNSLELDVTMEMLDEDDDASSDITHVIEIPVEAMHRERVRNERRIRQGGDAGPLQQEQGSPATIRNDIISDIIESRQEAEEAKQGALNNERGQQGNN